MVYVLQVVTGKELQVKKRLEELGIIAYVPEVFRWKRKAAEWTRDLTIPFKSYVFVEMTWSARNYFLVTQIENVIRLLCNDANGIHLSWMEAEWIRILSDDAFREPAEVKIEESGMVVITESLLYLQSKITKVDKHKRSATIELSILGETYRIIFGITIV